MFIRSKLGYLMTLNTHLSMCIGFPLVQPCLYTSQGCSLWLEGLDLSSGLMEYVVTLPKQQPRLGQHKLVKLEGRHFDPYIYPF